MNWKYYYTLVFTITINLFLSAQNQSIDLSGEWQVTLNTDNPAVDNSTGTNKMHGTIKLPSSLAQQGYGVKTEGSEFGVLTPEYKYLGVAVFEKEIEIPRAWKNKQFEIFLERVLWQSKVFIDDVQLSTKDALGTPHIHTLGNLSPGKHKLKIEVDNEMIHNIGDKGHAYGAYTQSIWSGIVGRMELIARDPTHISTIRTFSNLDKDQLSVELNVQSEKNESAQFFIEVYELGKNQIVQKIEVEEILNAGRNLKEIVFDLNGKLKKWNEFDPTVYVVKATIKTKKYSDTIESEFGYVKISHNGTNVTINDQPVFLRGNLDCVHFPLTGYPSTKVEDWERIFKIYKDYGLNHVRFHSWCPPEAAFKAASRIGIYIQAEASIWIDWWMSEDMKLKGRPEMDTKGYPKGLGKDSVRDTFVIEEMNRVVDFYGNNPSFTMFCIGNELGNSDFDEMQNWISDLKIKDDRRLYSVSTARKITEVDDYMATHYIQDVGRTRGLNGAGTDWDFEEVYSKMDIPIIAHEIGQWPVYPSWDEIDKYKGVLKARNFEEFKAVAQKNGVVDQDKDFKKASGALNQLMYKYETESFLRTKSCAGVQLLSMQDYQGQGEALIGWLDAFWDSKGITTPEKFRQHFNETVPLLRIEKFIWKNDETFEASAQLSHYGQYPIKDGTVLLEISSTEGDIIHQEKWPVANLEVGSLTDVGKFSFALNPINEASQLLISLELEGTDFKNEWNIWVFPVTLPEVLEDDILIIEEMNDEALVALHNGKKVLLLAHNLGNETNSTSVNFYPLYWSLTFFPGQGKTSIGLLIKDKHPAFNYFPTSFHSDWQWEPFDKITKGFILNDMPANYKPIAQVVDDFHRNNKEGVLFEFKVGKGKLLVSGFDLANKYSVVAKQLKYSLLRHMQTDDFNPVQDVSPSYLKSLFPLVANAEKVSTKERFENAILQVNAGHNLKENEGSKPWSKELDDVVVTGQNISYKVRAEGVWKDTNVTSWQGSNMVIEIDCPAGILGSFYVNFNDWNNQNREGILEFEGRKVKLLNHQGKDGQWIKFHVMREDSNDGKLLLRANMTNGGNLMISEMVLVKE